MTRTLIALLSCAALALCACSDDDNPPAADTGVNPDQSQTDIGVQPDGATADSGPLEHNVGQACTANTDCKAGSPTCVEGICTVSCVGDDPSTAGTNEDSCPDNTKQVCSTLEINSKEVDYCLLRCTPSDATNPCPAGSGTACTPWSVAYSVTLDVAVCWETPCADDKDCPVWLEKICTADADCDTTKNQYCDTVNGYCSLAGKCNTASGLCGAHTQGKVGAKIGDACKSDLDCANEMYCEREETDSGVTYVRNGYCTKAGCVFEASLTSSKCPAGSGCNRYYWGGICQKSCTLADATSCRSNANDFLGDYECYAWDNITEGGVAYADGPLCDYATLNTCDYWQGSGLECKDVGDSTNSTNMSCRDPKTNTTLTDPFDPKGICLDDTASGPKQP
jgi:hypothetical protein